MRTAPSAAPHQVRRGLRHVALVVGTLVALLARPSGATITVEGDQAFKDKVAAALKKIKDSDSTKKAKIEALETSTNDHKIKKTDEPKGSGNDPDDRTKAGNGTGTGSTTKWEPGGTERYDTDVDRDPTAALFHELVHACDADKGMRDTSGVTGPDGDVKKNEVNAVTVENMYRMLAGLPLREKYGGKRLPGSGTTTTSSPTTTTSASTTTTTMPPGCANANLFVSPGNCGQVVSNPPGINCPPTCNAMFGTSTPVRLFGQAPGSVFSGDCDSAGNVQLQNAHPAGGCALTCACSAP
jgi:hypothetical protein